MSVLHTYYTVSVFQRSLASQSEERHTFGDTMPPQASGSFHRRGPLDRTLLYRSAYFYKPFNHVDLRRSAVEICYAVLTRMRGIQRGSDFAHGD